MTSALLTIVSKAGGSLSKRLYLDASGKLVKDASPCGMSHGEAVMMAAGDAVALGRLIDGLSSHQAVTLGAIKNTREGEIRSIAAKRARPNGAISRSLHFFHFAPGTPAWCLLDFDGIHDMAPIEAAVPGLRGAAMVTRPSTSAGLIDVRTGAPIPGSLGAHIYIGLVDGADIPRFLTTLADRLWLAGHGFIKLSSVGAMLERTLIDVAVGSPERLVFEGPPTLGPGLRQDRETRADDGAFIDSRAACPDLTDAEAERVKALKDAAKAELKPQADVARAAWIDVKAPEIAKARELPEEEVRRQLKASFSGELGPAFPLVFDNIGEVSVADVLDDPERFLGETLRDPMEPAEQGPQCARLYRGRKDGRLFIKSFAHGGAVYFLPAGGAGGDPNEDEVDREERDLNQRIVEAPALAHEPEPRREFIVQDVVPDENLTLLTGEGGVGKTTVALHLGVAMRIDGEWLGMKVTQGTVLFVTSEDERKDVNFSLRAILKAEGKNLAHCPGLHILSLADRDACLAAAPAKLAPLAATPLWHALIRMIERKKPRLVIFDALADLFGGEENARRHVRGFIVLLKRLAIRMKLAVIMIAHPSLSGVNSGTGLSGSTDWHNGPRGRLYFQRPKNDDDGTSDRDARTLTVMKAQYSDAEGTVFRLRRRDGVFVYEGKNGGAAAYDRAAASAKAETVFLALLSAFDEQGRNVSPNLSANYAPAVFERDPDADGVSKAAFARAMSKLLKANRIHIETVGPPSRQRTKLTAGPALFKSGGETVQ
jgi:RecA-family ATPase